MKITDGLEPPSETVIPSEVNIRYHFYEPSGITDLEQFTAVTEGLCLPSLFKDERALMIR
jgi:hypothetical protein